MATAARADFDMGKKRVLICHGALQNLRDETALVFFSCHGALGNLRGENVSSVPDRTASRDAIV